MTFKSQLANDIETVYFNDAEFADDAIYNSHDSSIVDKAIKVILDLGADLGGTDYGAAEMVSIVLKLIDIPRPAIYDNIVINGTSYTIKQSTGGAGGVVTVTAETDRRQVPSGA